MNASGGWCAPIEVLYGPDVPPLWDDDGILKALCLPCETGGVEHPPNPWCAPTGDGRQ